MYDYLATVQVVTFWLQVIVLLEVGYGQNPSDWASQAGQWKQQWKAEMDRKKRI